MITFSLLKSFVLIFLRIFSIAHSKNIFHKKFYKQWRLVRIKKLLSIYNVKNKKILELGAATGATGKILLKYGANVTISDARAFLLEKIKSKNLTKIIINNDEDNWSKVFKNNERFDLIVHWGLLYHLYNWKADLKECLKLADYICLETIIFKVTERGGGEG
jgi:2-polyprenyl-3-methyl-5-hydroxy-6-metoxy-1,4-benzoquinol methylase